MPPSGAIVVWVSLLVASGATLKGAPGPPSMSFLQDSFARTLEEVLTGPLEGRKITLLLHADTQEVVDVDQLVSTLHKDLTLIKTGKGQPLEDLHEENLTDEAPSPGAAAPGGEDVLVMVVNRVYPWPLHQPPQTWSISALLLIKVGLECEAKQLLQSKLAQRTASVALLCPPASHNITEVEVSEASQVMTWLPYFPGGRLLLLGPWSPQAFPSFSSLFYDRFKSLEGATLHVASDNADAPLLFVDEEGQFEGTCKRVLDAISNKMNFTFTLTAEAPDNKWGELENGTWVGLLGEVHRGNKDLTVNYFTITHERAQYFDYSAAYLTEGFGFALANPSELPQWRNLVYPFTWVVWAVVGGVLLATTTALYLVAALQTRPRHSFGLLTALASVMMGLVHQAQERLPRSWSLRVFLASWWITAYIINISYTGNLIAVLTVPVFPSRIQTLQQLARSDYRLCMLDYGEFVPDAMLSSADRVLRSLGARMDLSPTTDFGFYGQEECAALVLDRKHAHIETSSYLKITYAEMGLADQVYFMREQIYEGNLAFFFRKHTPWRPAFDKFFRMMIEAGFVQKWQKDLLEIFGRPLSEEGEVSAPQPLVLAHLQGAFFLFALGLGAALAAFLLECKIGRKSLKNKSLNPSQRNPRSRVKLIHITRIF